jgi:hypothetical protein
MEITSALELFGTDKQKDYYKKNSKMQPATRDYLLKRLRCYYETAFFKSGNRGTKGYFIIGELLDEPEEIVDGRSSNGAHAMLEYRVPMDLLVAHGLYESRKHIPRNALTYMEWIIYFGLLSQREVDLWRTRYDLPKRAKLKSSIEGLEDWDTTILTDYTNCLASIGGGFKTTLKRLEDLHMFETISTPSALIEINGEIERIELDVNIYANILRKRADFLEKVGLSTWQLLNSQKAEVVQVRRKWEQELYNFPDENGDPMYIIAIFMGHKICSNLNKYSNVTKEYTSRFKNDLALECAELSFSDLRVKYTELRNKKFLEKAEKNSKRYVIEKTKVEQQHEVDLSIFDQISCKFDDIKLFESRFDIYDFTSDGYMERFSEILEILK